jgi:hypothetical protein
VCARLVLLALLSTMLTLLCIVGRHVSRSIVPFAVELAPLRAMTGRVGTGHLMSRHVSSTACCKMTPCSATRPGWNSMHLSRNAYICGASNENNSLCRTQYEHEVTARIERHARTPQMVSKAAGSITA